MTAQVDPPPAFLAGALPRTLSEKEMGKVFVGGLSRETTTNGLRVYFERFGDISDCVVMKDRSTGAPRGFGFVTYVSQMIADRVVMHRHVIDGKEVEAKPAVPRDSEVLTRPPALLPNGASAPAFPPMPPVTATGGAHTAPSSGGGGGGGGGAGGGGCGGGGGDFSSKKIFVGGLSHETGETDFVAYFGSYGQVIDCVIMCDPHTRKPRGFGFITYESSESVDRVCSNKFHDLNGKRVEVKRAIPQDRMLAEAGEGQHDEGDFMSHGRRGFFAGPLGRGPGGGVGKPQLGYPPHMMSAGPGGHGWVPPAAADGSVSESCAGLSAAMSTANSVLSQAHLAEAPQGPPAPDAGAVLTMSNAFMNLGGNFRSATNALSQGLRTTYGPKDEEQAPPQVAQAHQNGAGVVPNGQLQVAQVQQNGAGVVPNGQLTSQLLQEQLAHLAQQQKLLQQLQQQQLQLQMAQQQQSLQQQLHIMQQQPPPPPPPPAPNGPSSQQPALPPSGAPPSGAPSMYPSSEAPASAELSAQLARWSLQSGNDANANANEGRSYGGFNLQF